jgi:hypothetical protein
MRNSNQAVRGKRSADRSVGQAAPAISIVGLLIVLIVGACGPTAAAPSSPTPLPTPVITPDPHLTGPITADQVFGIIKASQLIVYATNATEGPAPIVKRINADLDGWQLRITAYSSAALLQRSETWKPGTAPTRGEPPYTLAALNIVIEYGPTRIGIAPSPPDDAHQAIAATLVGILDPLVWPIEQHSLVTIPVRTAAPAGPSPAPTKATKSASPSPSKAS